MTFTKSVLRLDVTPAQKLVLLAIKGERSKIIPISKLCELTGLAERTAKYAVKKLGADGLLLTEHRSDAFGHYAASRYILNTEGIVERSSMCKKRTRAWCKKYPSYIYSKSCDPETAKNITPPEERNQGKVVEFPR